jgi:hypothetical protein
MKSIKSLSNEHLLWTQPKTIHQFYELRLNKDIYGTLKFPKSSGSLAEVETLDGKWSFKRIGVFHTKITIREFGKDNDIALFKPNLMASSGSLEFSNGNSFIWEAANFWATRFELKDTEGNLLVAFRAGVDDPKLKDWFKTQARVEITEQAKNFSELSLIVLLGWYLIIILHMDSSTSAVVAAAT